MWKAFVLIAVLVVVYLFIPRYDLLKRTSSFNQEYELVEKGFWRQESCREAGKQFKIGFRCNEYSAWDRIISRRTAYNAPANVD